MPFMIGVVTQRNTRTRYENYRVIVQKLRWARDKDLSDALDVLIVQEPKKLDMDYVRHWCCEHGSESRLGDALAKIPD